MTTLEKLLADEEERIIVNQKRLAVVKAGSDGEPKVDEDTMVAWYRTPSEQWVSGTTVHRSLFPVDGAVVVACKSVSLAVMDENGAWLWSINSNMLLHKLRETIREIDERLLTLLVEHEVGTTAWALAERASTVSGRVFRDPDLWNGRGLTMLTDALKGVPVKRVTPLLKKARTLVGLLEDRGQSPGPSDMGYARDKE